MREGDTLPDGTRYCEACEGTCRIVTDPDEEG